MSATGRLRHGRRGPQRGGKQFLSERQQSPARNACGSDAKKRQKRREDNPDSKENRLSLAYIPSALHPYCSPRDAVVGIPPEDRRQRREAH